MEQAIESLGSHLQVRVSPSATVAEAIRLMKQNQTGCVLVVSNGALAGIFTERDVLLKLVGTGKDLDRMAISEVMTREPETVEGADSIRFALHKMSIGGFRHIPITSEGKLEGLITAKDVLRFLARELIYDQAA
jgi:CBS domain-containing protein